MTKPKKVMSPELKNLINAAMKHFIFELNDEQTRAKVRTAVSNILDTEYKKGDYFVNCDAKNNPETVLETHSLVVDVGLRNDKMYRFTLKPGPLDPKWVQ